MGKALRPQHIRFFLERMDDHDRVSACLPIPSDEDYLFTVKRRGMSSVTVHLADAYRYGELDFLARPKQLTRGSFVVMGMPHADFDEQIVEGLRAEGIGIGHVGKFMGALNSVSVAEYETKEEKAQKEKRR